MGSAFSSTRRYFIAGIAGLASTTPLRAAEELPKMIVTKDPTCDCCSGWVDHLKQAGFPIEIAETADIYEVKARLGVPDLLAACHTGELAGYVIEGHVPASAIKRLLSEQRQAIGLAVPGMPVGAPGMEAKGAEPELYEVILFGRGSRRTFARYRGVQEV